jgi:hypothetical protein
MAPRWTDNDTFIESELDGHIHDQSVSIGSCFHKISPSLPRMALFGLIYRRGEPIEFETNLAHHGCDHAVRKFLMGGLLQLNAYVHPSSPAASGTPVLTFSSPIAGCQGIPAQENTWHSLSDAITNSKVHPFHSRSHGLRRLNLLCPITRMV